MGSDAENKKNLVTTVSTAPLTSTNSAKTTLLSQLSPQSPTRVSSALPGQSTTFTNPAAVTHQISCGQSCHCHPCCSCNDQAWAEFCTISERITLIIRSVQSPME